MRRPSKRRLERPRARPPLRPGRRRSWASRARGRVRQATSPSRSTPRHHGRHRTGSAYRRSYVRKRLGSVSPTSLLPAPIFLRSPTMSALRRAKLVCTLGPACDSAQGLASLIEAGMDVARFNFSHGTHEEHGQRLVASARGERAQAQGHRGSAGPLRAEDSHRRASRAKFDLPSGVEVALVEGEESKDERVIPINYEGLARDVRVDDKILFDDGRLVLTVLGIEAERVRARVDQGGGMRDHVGVHLPSKTLRISCAHRQGQGGPRLRSVERRRLHRDELRAARGGPAPDPRDLPRLGRADAGHREDRDARRGREPRERRRRERRRDGGARRPRRGVPAGARARDPAADPRRWRVACGGRSSWRPRCCSR